MPQPDTLLEGKYEILSKLREGGMGTIYLVRHRLLDQIRVIKVMRAHARADPDLRRRFLDEAKMATRLNHPHLCTIHDFAIDDDATAYLVMEFIEGVNLAELRSLHGSPGLSLSLEIAHQALLALGYLHRKGVVHRDVAPDNLMLSKRDDGVPHVKIIDLGIAKEADRPIEMTATGVFLGKLRYASPEQAGSLAPGERLDGRSDLYSLGIVLYELLTGVRPFPGESPAELLRAQLFTEPIPFAQSDPKGKVPSEVRAVILKALQKKRQDRFASAEDFDQQIAKIQRRLDPGDLERTRAVLAQLPAVLPAVGSASPSAQSRLNEQFAPSTTPLPSGPHLTLAPTVSATSALGGAPAPTPESASPASRRTWLWALLVAAAVGLAALLVRPRPAAPSGEPRAADQRLTPAEAPAGAALAASPEAAPPTAAPTAEPTAPPPPTEAPAATRPPASEPAAQAAVRVPRPTPPPRARAVAPTAAPVVEALLARPSPLPESVPPPRPAPPTAPERPAAVPPATAATSPSAPAPTENDRIRDTIRRYEKAQSTLDAGLYARIFPSVDRERIERAFQSLSSQSVELEIRKIQIDPSGTRARVEGYEKRTAVPRAGTEQRVTADRVLELEKRADGWVILRLN